MAVIYWIYKQYSAMNLTTLPPFIPVPVPLAPVWVQAASVSVAAGFPSPADDHQVERIELMSQLVKHPQATFYVRIQGDSMRDAGILDGSVVLVDKAIKPRHGHIVIAVVDGDFTCKRLHQRGGTMRLKPENPAYQDIVPKDGQTVEVWGVVVATIHQHIA